MRRRRSSVGLDQLGPVARPSAHMGLKLRRGKVSLAERVNKSRAQRARVISLPRLSCLEEELNEDW